MKKNPIKLVREEWLDDDPEELLKAIRRVRELHKPVTSIFNDTEVCITCSHICKHEMDSDVLYPCPTIEALDGEQ